MKWVTQITSALDSPRVAREKIEETRRVHGESSDVWASQVLAVPLDKQREGVFVLSHYHSSWRRHPLNPAAPPESVLPYDAFVSDVEKVTRRRRGEPAEQPQVVVGCDFSGGGDESVACFRIGGVQMQFVPLDGRTEAAQAMGVSQAVQAWNADLRHPPVMRILCERGGYGKGATESLRKEFGPKIVGLWDPSAAPRDSIYGNNRAASLVQLSILLERGEIALLPHEKLEQDLAAVARRETDTGKLFVSKKTELAEILGRSTDYLDALAICFSGFQPGRGDFSAVQVTRFAL